MAIEQKKWDDVTDEEWMAWGNTTTEVTNHNGDVVFAGLTAGWQETPIGGLELRRRVTLDPGADHEHTMAFTFAMVGPGEWAFVHTDAFSYDLEGIVRREQEEAEAMQQQQAAIEPQRRGLAVPGGPSRAQRRG